MAKFIVEVWLDGFDSDEEMRKGLDEWIREELRASGASVTVIPIPDDYITNLEERVDSLDPYPEGED